MLVLVVLTMLAAMTTGSGNAFYAFVEMIPKLAHSGINPAYLSIPMQASNLGVPFLRYRAWSLPLPGWQKYRRLKW
jgi:C4-dicarboxylate transporter